MSDPLVSFVVLSYNFAPFLKDCVDSILRQRGGYDFEIILIDDASTDQTRTILRECRDPRVRLIEHEHNLGHVATVNEALSHARGRYVARIDGDDRYREDFLSWVVPVFEAFSEVALVYGDAAIMDENGDTTSVNSDRVHAGADHKGNELMALLAQNFICAPTVIARREAWEACLPVPDGLAFHDWYFTLLMARRDEFYYLHHVLADYRVHRGNHHTRIIANRTEEPSIFYMLDRVFSEVGPPAMVQRRSRQMRRRIYGRHYLTLADKYFGMGMNGDARRCYWAAIRKHPSHALNPGVQRRLAATILGRERYESGKALVRSVVARTS